MEENHLQFLKLPTNVIFALEIKFMDKESDK
jgi:hypothetical protein